MANVDDHNTRYYLDLDLKAGKILGWGHGQRDKLSQHLSNPLHHRVFLTKGQYHKLAVKKPD